MISKSDKSLTCRKRITAAFPEEIKASVQYGPLVQATAFSLGGYQLLSRYARPLCNAPSAHADETSCTLHGKRHGLHVFGTEELTAYHLDAKRGVEAMERMGLIPRYRSVLIHDCLGAYFTFLMCWHGLCNAHLQRELTYLFEELDQTWAAILIELLLKAKDLAEREMARKEGSRRIIGEGR
jgi:hypothetical protein